MRIVYLGTPDFAVKPLEAILKSKHQVLAVVTQPDKPVGRKGIITPCDVKVCAINNGVKTLSYDKIRVDGVEELKSLNPDIMVTCAYGQILSQEILDIAKYGVINIHASLLPKYRGSAPIQWAIINGEDTTGVTIMQTDIGVDTGDIIKSVSLKINDGESAGELFDRLSILGAQTIVGVLDDIESGNYTKTKQNESLATHTKMLKKEDGIIDFNKSSKDIVNLVRGLNPWPVAYTYLKGKMLKITSATKCDIKGNVGEVLFADIKNGLIIGTLDGSIKINELQLEGAKKMSSHDFLLGNKIQKGDKLGI